MQTLSDNVLKFIIVLLEALSVYNMYDTWSAYIMHRTSAGVSARGTIVNLKKAMRRDRARLFFPTNGKMDSYDVNCDYMVDLEYENEDGNKVFLKDYIIPSTMKLTSGSTTPIYRQGQSLPIKYSRRFAKLVVVDLPEVRARQTGLLWLALWTMCFAALSYLTASAVFGI